MITIACLQCYLALRTSGEFDEVDYLVGMKCDWYPDRYPCPREGCAGKMTLTDVMESKVLDLLQVHDLTPQECFQAFNGMGLPKERECSAEAVREMLAGQKIVSLDLRDIRNAERAVINSLTLSNGYRIFLGSSPQGAVIYRMAPPRSVVQEVLGEG